MISNASALPTVLIKSSRKPWAIFILYMVMTGMVLVLSFGFDSSDKKDFMFHAVNIFNKYKNKDGTFKESLTNDVEGLLELYEAAYMRVAGEVVLDDALAFTKGQLEKITKDPLRWNCTQILSRHIEEALERPIWKRLPRLEALRYIPFYEQQDAHNESLLRLAKLEFNRLQSLHKRELSQVSKWWKDLEPQKNLHYVRDRLPELYFWAVGAYFVLVSESSDTQDHSERTGLLLYSQSQSII
ncbi:putative germacrene-A synthase [Helianthus annuus]|uniref:Germacrene-A synthase n=1 Tax=Helianthus annuus TaxID=4232 RepID=A0A251VL21_HELAN|nr:putative germacrene-A synthase [Helianthus annuus]